MGVAHRELQIESPSPHPVSQKPRDNGRAPGFDEDMTANLPDLQYRNGSNDPHLSMPR